MKTKINAAPFHVINRNEVTDTSILKYLREMKLIEMKEVKSKNQEPVFLFVRQFTILRTFILSFRNDSFFKKK